MYLLGTWPANKQENLVNLFRNVINTTFNNRTSIKIKPKDNATLINTPWFTHAVINSIKIKNN